MRKIIVLLPILFIPLLFNCKGKNNESSDSVGSANTENSTLSDADESSKVYSVTEFVDIYAKEKGALEGKIAVIEGYCLGYVPLKNKGDNHYRIVLSSDEESKSQSKKAFFLFNDDTDKKDFIRAWLHRKKLKIKARITDEELFHKPVLTDSKLVQ